MHSKSRFVDMSFLKEVSQKSFAFKRWSSLFVPVWRKSRRKASFWASNFLFWRKSRRKASFFKPSTWLWKHLKFQVSWIWHHLKTRESQIHYSWISNPLKFKPLKFKPIEFQVTWSSNPLNSKPIESQINWINFKSIQFQINRFSNKLNLKPIEFQIIWIWNQLKFKTIWIWNHLKFKPAESHIKWISYFTPIGLLSLETSATASRGRFNIMYITIIVIRAKIIQYVQIYIYILFRPPVSISVIPKKFGKFSGKFLGSRIKSGKFSGKFLGQESNLGNFLGNF